MRLRFVALMAAAAFGATVPSVSLAGDEPRAVKQDYGWVAKQIEAWQPNSEERAFDQIGWAKDVHEALRLGKQHRRPVFLFTYDGASLSCYRC